MKEVKDFIEAFLKIEAKTIYNRRFPDIETFNQNLKEMNSFCTEELHDTFGMVPQTSLKDDSYYEKWANKNYPALRHLFKISEYKNNKYGTLYIAYVSLNNPRPKKFKYWQSFFIAKVDNKLKILKEYYLDDDLDSDSGIKLWNESHGLKELNLEKVGKFVHAERYLEPADCEYSMEDYKAEK